MEPTLDLKPNSNKYKAEQKKDQEVKHEVKKVVKGKTVAKKEPISRKFADVFLSENAQDVKSYILIDVLVPAIKDTIADMITNSISMIFWGTSGGRRSSSSGRPASKVSYSSYYKSPNERERASRRSTDRYGFNDIIFETRGDCQEVMECLDDIIDRYKEVTVADFYELAGQDSTFTDQKYGWTDLADMAPVRCGDGYKIRMPKAQPLD